MKKYSTEILFVFLGAYSLFIFTIVTLAIL